MLTIKSLSADSPQRMQQKAQRQYSRLLGLVQILQDDSLTPQLGELSNHVTPRPLHAVV